MKGRKKGRKEERMGGKKEGQDTVRRQITRRKEVYLEQTSTSNLRMDVDREHQGTYDGYIDRASRSVPDLRGGPFRKVALVLASRGVATSKEMLVHPRYVVRRRRLGTSRSGSVVHTIPYHTIPYQVYRQLMKYQGYLPKFLYMPIEKCLICSKS